MDSVYIVVEEVEEWRHGGYRKTRTASDFFSNHQSALEYAMTRSIKRTKGKYYICSTKTEVEAKIEPVITEVFNNG